MRNNSTRQKGKKNSTSQFQSFEHHGMKIYNQLKKPGKPSREKGGTHADMVPEGFGNFIAKDDRPANSHGVTPLETIWIIFDETTYKDPAPKTLDEPRQ